MNRPPCWTWMPPLAAGLVLCLAQGTAATGSEMPCGASAFASSLPRPIPPEALALVIDEALAEGWSRARVEPVPPADDATFFRRASIDIAGKIPTAAEVRDFLRDDDPAKRRKTVDRLLEGPGYVSNATTIWKGLLIPEASSNFNINYYSGDFETWLRAQFAENRSYDEIVRQVLTASLGSGRNFTTPLFGQRESTPSSFAFYAAKEGKPENLAAGASRLFLGVRLECAQCHDHPFADWKRDQFWSFAAFFAGVERQGDGDSIFQAREVRDRRELAIPGSDRVVQAAFLDGSRPEWSARQSPRETLAGWLASAENPYFARAAVNRVWAQFFGTGLVDPVDDMDEANEASHPELLDALASQFAANGFDFKYLIRALTASRAYGLSSDGYSPGGDDPRLFARMPVRGMMPHQLYESIVRATGIMREKELPPFYLVESPRKDFLERFTAPEERPTDRQTSILQALTLMNGRLASDATSLERGGTLPAVADAFFLDTPGKVEALYLAALSRPPRPEELAELVPYVDRGGPALDPKKALSDVFWALLNSAEFALNH